jgi:hypothetical protein
MTSCTVGVTTSGLLSLTIARCGDANRAGGWLQKKSNTGQKAGTASKAKKTNLPVHQGCQLVYFQTKFPYLEKFWRALECKTFVYIFYAHFEYIKAIWYSLCSVANFVAIRYISPHFRYIVSRTIWQPGRTLSFLGKLDRVHARDVRVLHKSRDVRIHTS